MQLTGLGKRQYNLLGKLLANHHPDMARQLLERFCPDIQPPEQDLSVMKDYFTRYCRLRDLEPNEYRGPLFKSGKVKERKIFIGVMLHLYDPRVYYQPQDSIILRKGLVKELCGVLDYHMCEISKHIREALLFEKIYEEFRTEVGRMTELLLQPQS